MPYTPSFFFGKFISIRLCSSLRMESTRGAAAVAECEEEFKSPACSLATIYFYPRLSPFILGCRYVLPMMQQNRSQAPQLGPRC